MKKIAFVILFFVFFFSNSNCSAKIDDLILDFDKIKAKTKSMLPKKPKKEKPKMPETVQEYEIQSQNVPLIERKLELKEKEADENIIMPKAKYSFDRYNYPQGTRELNIEEIKKNLYSYPYVVADNEVKYVAYPRYYFSPQLNQISSEFYVEKLDTTKAKTRRILEYQHHQQARVPVVETGMFETYPNLFRGLTLVDWSKDSKKLLIRERVGSTLNGIYKTYLYVHFMSDGIKNEQTIKLIDFDEVIKNYYLDWENKQLIKYRYDICPLGFSAENDNLIIALCYVFDKNNNKIFLGTWGYNLSTNETILISKTDYSPNLTINGLILKQVID